jgi:mannose-6-phosphate isomerase-like protein (cupin superfamily)
MPKYKWEELPESVITPGKSVAKGSTLYGDMIFMQIMEYKQDRGDGKVGAHPHFHPEEQMFIVLKGIMNIREEGKDWYAVHPGELCWIPAYATHEAVWDGDGLVYNFKTRVPGHSWYDGSWQPGSEDAWNQHFGNFKEMIKKYKEVVPWEE